jgi:hypothetical protein
MSNADTFCGVLVNAFAQAPTPRELGRIVAHMGILAQAEFWAEFAEAFDDCTALKDRRRRIAEIAEQIFRDERAVNGGSASEMIVDMAAYIENANKGEL